MDGRSNFVKTARACVGDVVYVTTEKIEADRCEVLQMFLQYPKKVCVKSFATGELYMVYPEWHCYSSEEDAKKAAEKYKGGYRDIIY